eukprot:221209_1
MADLQAPPIMFELSGEFNGHANSITSIAVAKRHPSTVITASTDGICVVWNLSQTEQFHNNGVRGDALHIIMDAKIIRTLRSHDQPIQSIDIDANGTYAITSSHDKTIKLWSLTTLMLQQFFEGHQQSILSVSLTGDASCIVSGSTDSSVLVWNAKGQIIYRIAMEHDWSASNVLISPDGSLVIVSCMSFIKIYKMSKYVPCDVRQHCQSQFSARVAKIDISLDGDLLAIGLSNAAATVKVYHIKHWKMVNEMNHDQGDAINGLCFVHNKYWLCVAVDGFIIIWDLHQNTKISTLNLNGLRQNIDLTANCIVYPPGNTIFVGCSDGILRTWSLIHSDRYRDHDWTKAMDYSTVSKKQYDHDIGIQKNKNDKLRSKIHELELQIQEYETKWTSCSEELIRSRDEYQQLSKQFCELASKHRNCSNLIHYTLWDFDNVIDWICTLDEGKYQQYVHILHKTMKKENIRGLVLPYLNTTDLHRLGIADYEDKLAVIQHIKALTKTKQTRKTDTI